MKKILRRLRRILIKFKIYIIRTQTYISIINSGMILFLFLSKLKEIGFINFELDTFFLAIVLIGIIVFLFIGWLEVEKLKGTQEESTVAFELTPPLVEMKSKIDKMYEEFERNLRDSKR